MKIIKNQKNIKLIWESKISISKTKPSSNNNLKREYVTYRAVFPLSLYYYLDYENCNFSIVKLDEKLFKINMDNINKNILNLKENNNNNSKKNNSGKRMPLKKSIFGEHLLKNSQKVVFYLFFKFDDKKINDECLIEFI